MDTNAVIAHARARFDHETARRLLKEKYQARMLFAYGGGMWRAGPELLTVLHVYSLAKRAPARRRCAGVSAT